MFNSKLPNSDKPGLPVKVWQYPQHDLEIFLGKYDFLGVSVSKTINKMHMVYVGIRKNCDFNHLK